MCVYSVLLCVFHCTVLNFLSSHSHPPPPPPPPPHTHTHKASSPLSYLFVPCYTAGKNAEAAGEGCVAHGVYSIVNRQNSISRG